MFRPANVQLIAHLLLGNVLTAAESVIRVCIQCQEIEIELKVAEPPSFFMAKSKKIGVEIICDASSVTLQGGSGAMLRPENVEKFK